MWFTYKIFYTFVENFDRQTDKAKYKGSSPELKNLVVEPSIELIKNIKNVEVSRVQSVKCVVRLPDPKNMNSPKSDSNKSNPSSRKRKQRNSKKIDEFNNKIFWEENTDEAQATNGRTDKETNRLSDIVPTWAPHGS